MSGLGGDMLFWGQTCPLLPELPSPELTPVFAFSLDTEARGRGLYYETRQFCSVRQRL